MSAQEHVERIKTDKMKQKLKFMQSVSMPTSCFPACGLPELLARRFFLYSSNRMQTFWYRTRLVVGSEVKNVDARLV